MHVSAAGNYQRRSHVTKHGIQAALAMFDVGCHRLRDRVLKDHFVGFQAIAVDGHNPFRVEIHGHDADQDQHAPYQAENRHAGRQRQAFEQALPFPL
jgi:hypothetical protein